MTRPSATDEQLQKWTQEAAEALKVLLIELQNERSRGRELFTRAEAAEDALYDAQRGWRERVSDWWLNRRGGGI